MKTNLSYRMRLSEQTNMGKEDLMILMLILAMNALMHVHFPW